MTELQQAARTAWAAMDDNRSKLQRMVDQMAGERRGPMQPGFALDMVQDVCGERGDALTALIEVGAGWLESQWPRITGSELDSVCRRDAGLVGSCLRADSLGEADAFRRHIEERCGFAAHPMATSGERHDSHAWSIWAEQARRVIDRCRLLVGLVFPELLKDAA